MSDLPRSLCLDFLSRVVGRPLYSGASICQAAQSGATEYGASLWQRDPGVNGSRGWPRRPPQSQSSPQTRGEGPSGVYNPIRRSFQSGQPSETVYPSCRCGDRKPWLRCRSSTRCATG